MKPALRSMRIPSKVLALGCLLAASGFVAAQTPAVNPPPAGKPASRPLFRDPPLDAPTDPVLCFNAVPGDPNQPTYMDLKSMREEEK